MAAHTPPRHADRVQAAVASSQAANSALVASWRRSSGLHRLDPTQHRPPQRLSEAELRQVRERAEPLALAARSSLDRLYQAVGSVGCCVLLADSDGVPIDRRGAPADDETFHDWGLWPGALWSESSEGTNGIGTCLVEQRALTIHRDQHFFSRNTLLSCTAAPIHDHAGAIAGVLDVSSCRADLTEAFAQLISLAVLDATRRIEAEMFRAAFPGARFLLAPETDKASAGLVAIDADDLVIGATRSARQSLGLTAVCLEKPFPAADLFKAPTTGHEDLRTVERSALHRALARVDGNVSAAAEALGISRATLHRKLKRFGIGRAH